MKQDRITIVEPTGVRREMPLPPQGLTIGRETNNNLVLDYQFVSRHHTQIMLSGEYYYVTDLGSINGTYMGHTLLKSNEPTIWGSGTPLHIGDVLIRLDQVDLEPTMEEREIRRREETQMVGWAAGGVSQIAANPGTNRMWIVIALVLVFLLLIVCAVAGVGAYFYVL